MPASQRPTIEINGRVYDAVTGQLLTKSEAPTKSQKAKKPTAKVKASKPVIPHRQGHSIDGFTPTKKSATEIKPPAPKPTTVRQPRQAASVHHKTKRSQTLNRAVVSPPAKTSTTKPKTQSATQAPVKNPLVSNRNHVQRVSRAATINKSAVISKFGQNLPRTEPQPETKPVIQSIAKPIQKAPPPKPSPKEELIARHLATAAQSEAKPVPKLSERINDWVRRKRVSSLMASSIAAILLIGYVTYLNIPRIALRVAANRAGFDAEMPSYSPSGFSFSGPVAYSDGQISIGYNSNTDDRNYVITERETSWDSQTLLDKHVLGETDVYSTYQERGLTVYIYDGSFATWVNGGIWYTISGESTLTTEQLLKIASSL